ncbi:MAG: ABC transporter substrate-binding protein, partial [Desulfosarcina sp.]
MVLIARTTIAILILVVAGCAPTPPSPISKPRPTPEIPVPSAFADAEQAFENGQYPEALAAYNTFVKESYDDPLAVMALVKIGKIYRLTGRKEDALAVFSRIIREFPASDLAADASLEFLTLLFESGDFEAVIDRGRAFTETTDPTLRRAPFFLLMADAQAAMGAYLEAAQYYYRAWNTASDTQIALAWSKLEETAELLSTEALEQLIAEVTDPEVMGLLLYRLGMAFIMDEDYDQALDALQLFVERFPEHPDHQDASDMILSLVERARFTPFTVGCVLPLSGPYAIFGQRALNGIELALNRSGSASDGIPFRVVVKDSRSDPGVAVEAVDELDQQKVGAILGPMVTSESAAANADARGIPMLVFTQREGIPDMGAYVFRNFITPQMQVRALVSFAVEELGVMRFAVLYPDENYGWTYMNLFWDQVVEYGGVVNAVEPYDPAGTDFAEPIKKMVGLYYDPPADLSGIASPVRRPVLPWSIPQPAASDRELIADPVVQISGIPLDRETIDDIVRRNPARDDQWHPQVDFDAVFI